jgi:imidazolonepropionase-like amidohydrolase
MRSVWLSLFLVWGLVSLTFAQSSVKPSDTFALPAVRVYTAPDSPPIDDAVVVIHEGKIAAVGPRSQVVVPKAASTLSCPAGVIVAGFQNSHVHFTEDRFAGAATRPAAELDANVRAMLTRYGFTTVLDTASELANTLALRDRIERGEIRGPRIFTAGMPIYPPKGIPFYLLDMPPEFLAQLPQPETPEAALAAVRVNLAARANATKLFVATPVKGRRIVYMPREIAAAVAQETHRRQRMVVAHPTDVEGIRIAIDAGVNVLVHTTLGDEKVVWEEALIKDMLAHDMAVVPTLQLWGYELRKAKVGQGIIELATGDTVEQLRAFAAAGGQVLFGTDVGYMTDYDPTEEYRLMAHALTPMEILASLTTAPAARWKEDARRGRVAVGLDADLVVLEGDPAADPRKFAKVACTVRAGRLLYSAR